MSLALQEHETPVELALRLALMTHQGQRSFRGRPYILHSIHVIETMDPRDETAQIVALLHDTVEDTDITLQQIEDLFGNIVMIEVRALTHHNSEPYDDYIDRVASRALATQAKLADLRDNMRVERLPKMTASATK